MHGPFFSMQFSEAHDSGYYTRAPLFFMPELLHLKIVKKFFFLRRTGTAHTTHRHTLEIALMPGETTKRRKQEN